MHWRQIFKVLPPEGTIQAEFVAHSGNISRLSVVAQHRDNRVAGHQMNYSEGNCRDTYRNRDERENSLK
jgi:hypothetical protein